jgi:hypothetical protein
LLNDEQPELSAEFFSIEIAGVRGATMEIDRILAIVHDDDDTRL